MIPVRCEGISVNAQDIEHIIQIFRVEFVCQSLLLRWNGMDRHQGFNANLSFEDHDSGVIEGVPKAPALNFGDRFVNVGAIAIFNIPPVRWFCHDANNLTIRVCDVAKNFECDV